VKHFIAAQEALAAGDRAGAMEALTKSIEAKPTGWAYLERAKLYLEQGDDEAAIADCEAGLALDPENIDLKWLLGEAKKPKAERFKGKNAEPPSAGK
jgi:tetratricopeptide (TPR) repeat protein